MNAKSTRQRTDTDTELSDEDRLYQEYLRVVEGFQWYRTYYPGDAYANETFENLQEARQRWDSTLIVEPVDPPVASGRRDGFEYVRVTQRLWSSGNVGKLWGVSAQQRVLAAMQARNLEQAFAAALRGIVQETIAAETGSDRSAPVGDASVEDRIIWACLTADAPSYFRAAILAAASRGGATPGD